MASFRGNPKLRITTLGAHNYEVIVEYTIDYTPEELALSGNSFAESMALFEDDSGEPFGGDNDFLLNRPIRVFHPASPRNTRTFEFRLGEFNTEADNEEVYAVVHHRRNIDGLTSTMRESNRVSLPE